MDDFDYKEDFKNKLEQSSHKKSFVMADITYIECLKATSLWYIDIPIIYTEEEVNED